MLNAFARGLRRMPVFTDLQNLQNDDALALCPLSRRSYRQDIAQNIRDGAGIPVTIETGIQSVITPGLTNAGILSAGTKLNIASETNIQNIASSGTGTQNDPYIVSHKEYNGNSAINWAHRFTDSSGSYYIKFTNCWFHDYTAQIIWPDTAASLYIEFEHCEFSNSYANAELFLHETGHITLTNCLFSGCNSYAAYLLGAGSSGSLTVRNLMIDESRNAWAGGCDIFYGNIGDILYDIKYVETDNSFSTGLGALFQILGCAAESSFTHIKMDNHFDHCLTDYAATPAQKSITLQYFDLNNCVAEAVKLRSLNNALISHGYVSHTSNGAGCRLIELFSDGTDDTIRVQNTDIEYIKCTKQTGSGADNEAIESARAENCRIRYCWATECTEDAFEHIAMIRGCTIEYVVGDNCAGQVADFFKQHDESTWTQIDSSLGSENAENSNSYAHHIYGDCGSYGLILSGFRGCVFHDIYINNTASTNLVPVRIEDRDGIVVRDIVGAGPLPLQAQRGNGTSTSAIGVNGGADITASYFDNTAGQSPLESL